MIRIQAGKKSGKINWNDDPDPGMTNVIAGPGPGTFVIVRGPDPDLLNELDETMKNLDWNWSKERKTNLVY